MNRHYSTAPGRALRRRLARTGLIAVVMLLCLLIGAQPVGAQVALRSVKVAPDGVHVRLAADLTKLSAELRDKLPGWLREAVPEAFGELNLLALRYVNQRVSITEVGFNRAGPQYLGMTLKVRIDADRERRKLSWEGVSWESEGAMCIATAIISGRLAAVATGGELTLDALVDQVRVDPQFQELRGWLAISTKLNGYRIGGRRLSTSDAGLTAGTTIQSFELVSVDTRTALIDALVVAPPRPPRPDGGKEDEEE